METLDKLFLIKLMFTKKVTSHTNETIHSLWDFSHLMNSNRKRIKMLSLFINGFVIISLVTSLDLARKEYRKYYEFNKFVLFCFFLFVPPQNRTPSQSKYSQSIQEILELAIVDSASVLEDPTTFSSPLQKSVVITNLERNSSC